MSDNDFELKVEGVNPSRVLRFDGPDGRFFACTAGRFGPEDGDIYFYCDDYMQLFFGARELNQRAADGPVEVFTTSNKINFGSKAKYSSDDILRFKRNITWLFNNRMYGNLKIENRGEHPVVDVTFVEGCF